MVTGPAGYMHGPAGYMVTGPAGYMHGPAGYMHCPAGYIHGPAGYMVTGPADAWPSRLYGGVVTHKILVSAQGVLGQRVWGQGLTISTHEF